MDTTSRNNEIIAVISNKSRILLKPKTNIKIKSKMINQNNNFNKILCLRIYGNYYLMKTKIYIPSANYTTKTPA